VVYYGLVIQAGVTAEEVKRGIEAAYEAGEFARDLLVQARRFTIPYESEKPTALEILARTSEMTKIRAIR